MKVAELLDIADVDPTLEVSDVQIDSRECGPGSLFFAMPGLQTHGARYVDEAVDRGATAIVASEALNVRAPVVVVDALDLHRTLVRASASIVSHPERELTIVGVTGTNGKTSVTTILASMWQALGRDADVIGTLTHARTTPAPPELFRELRSFVSRSQPSRHPMVSMEVSSHALDQGRVDGLFFDVAVFTNLSHDHLDYHGTMESYFAAKMRLFEANRSRRAVVWVDDEWGVRVTDLAGVPCVKVRRSEATDISLAIGSTAFSWRGHPVNSSLSGEYNLDNSLLALAAAVELGVNPSDAAAAMAQVATVPGRFEVVAQRPDVVVDYAHTPDGLRRLLTDVRRLSRAGRIIVVFGCGGDRDRAKRPLMGRVASELADEIYVTSDNPRSEDPDVIINEIVGGITEGAKWHRDRDRRAAIKQALEAADSGDVVVIAGKGHETTQTIGTTVVEFDDRLVVAELRG